jgi:hypothetical protein
MKEVVMKFTSRFAAAFLAVVLAVGLTGRAALAGDADAFLGSWVLNAAKSSLPQGGPPINMTLTVSAAGGGKYKSMTEMSVAGQAYKVEITFAIDGKDYTPVVTPAPPGGTPPTTQSYERVNGRSYKSATKMNGQVQATSTSEVSADGKTMTVTTSGAAGGAAAGVLNTLVFDKK